LQLQGSGASLLNVRDALIVTKFRSAAK
jgi:hypothetical protein